VNEAVFRWINNWPESFAPLMKFFSEATNYSWFKILLALLALGMLIRGAKTRTTIIQALLAFPLANELTDVLKATFPAHRPYQELADVIHRSGVSQSMGTASAHSANMAAVAFVFCYHLGWWGIPWVVAALATGLSRIYNGDHYPYQVLLGWTCGVVIAFIVVKTWELIQRRRSGVDEEEETDGLEPT
jgi:undecaprenyl-diphosphatase